VRRRQRQCNVISSTRLTPRLHKRDEGRTRCGPNAVSPGLFRLLDRYEGCRNVARAKLHDGSVAIFIAGVKRGLQSVSASAGVTNNKASKGDSRRIRILHGSSVMTASMALRASVVPSFPPRRFDRLQPFASNFELQIFSKFPQTSLCRRYRYPGLTDALNLESPNFCKYLFGGNLGYQWVIVEKIWILVFRGASHACVLLSGLRILRPKNWNVQKLILKNRND
jgi:hypothetical protein